MYGNPEFYLTVISKSKELCILCDWSKSFSTDSACLFYVIPFLNSLQLSSDEIESASEVGCLQGCMEHHPSYAGSIH
jgi:hypothetical protein